MPVEFLSDDEVAAYGRFTAAPSRADLERVFFLDDEDRALVAVRRGEYSQLGFALQLVTVRWLGTFLEDPVDVPVVGWTSSLSSWVVDDSSRAGVHQAAYDVVRASAAHPPRVRVGGLHGRGSGLRQVGVGARLDVG